MSIESKERFAKNTSYFDFLTKENKISCNKLEIANFQRNYVWKSKNIKALFGSIIDSDVNDSVYLGNLVIQRTTEGNIGGDFVVDGQQRLLTLSLIIKAIYKLKSIKECKDILFFKKNKPRIKLSRKTLNSVYLSILNDEEIFLNNVNESQKNFLKNYNDILRKLKKIDDIDLFFDKVKKIEFVVIKCPSTHDVNQLFESLNSKGEKLSSVQLSKNAILSSAKVDDDILEKINSKWEKLESRFEDKKSKIIWFDKFFRHRWFYINGYISDKNLFDAVSVAIKNDGAEKFTEELLEDSGIYLPLRKGIFPLKSIYLKSISEPETRKIFWIIELIRKMNVDQVYSVLLAIIKYGKNNRNYFEKMFYKDIDNLWKFLVLIKYSKKINPNSYENIFANFCKDIHNIPKGKNLKLIRNDFFKSLFLLVPKKEDFIEVLNDKIKCIDTEPVKSKKEISFHEDRDVIRSLLLIYLTDGERIISEKSETIEHIIPKGDLSKWGHIDKKYRDEIAKLGRYKLGNITILEKKFNSKYDVGNDVFDVKFKKAYKKSSFLKNKELNSFKEKFNSKNPMDAVLDRGCIIADNIYANLVKINL